jgi:hypothetical protein
VRQTVEISGTARSDNFAYYRLAYFEGLDPVNIQVIADNVTEQRENAVLGVWNTTGLDGLYTLLLTVVRGDGTFDEVNVQVSVDNTAPSAEILFPLQDQTIFTDEDWVTIQAQVNDDISIERVEFFVDGSGVPFGIRTVPPYTESWPIPGPGCHTFRVKAVDAAGNEADSAAVRACLVSRGANP